MRHHLKPSEVSKEPTLYEGRQRTEAEWRHQSLDTLPSNVSESLELHGSRNGFQLGIHLRKKCIKSMETKCSYVVILVDLTVSHVWPLQ